MARRYQRLSEEISELDEQLDRLVAQEALRRSCCAWRVLAPRYRAASLLMATGDDPERIKNEAAFAHPCVWGWSDCGFFGQDRPPPRLNRHHGDRDANIEPST